MPVSGWTILCDFDGTISVEDVIDSLLDRFGLDSGWLAVHAPVGAEIALRVRSNGNFHAPRDARPLS